MKIFLIISLAIMILILLILAVYLIIGYCSFKFCFNRKGGLLKRFHKNRKQHLERMKIDEEYFKKDFQKIQINSEDGLRLIGFYKDIQSNKLAILVHGLGANHTDVSNIAKIFEKRGFDLLAIDLRCHGQSLGQNVTMGKEESKDILLWINKMIEIKQEYKIVLFGMSMGATAICLALGEKLPKNVVLAIEDSGFDNAEKQLSYVYSRRKFHTKVLFKIFCSFTKKSAGYDLKSIDATQSLKKCHIPVMFIHGEADNFVPTEMVYNLASQVPESRRRIYVASEAEHLMSYSVNENKYEKEIGQFLNQFYM